MYKMLRRIFGEQIELFTIPSQEEWLVEVDSRQIEQVILNLSVNTRDAMPQGGKLQAEVQNQIVADLQPALMENILTGEYMALLVSDDGVGMSGDVQQKAFEPFFTTKPEGLSTGLGLSTVYGTIKQNGGIHSAGK